MKLTYDSPTLEMLGGVGADSKAGVGVAVIAAVVVPPVIIHFVSPVIYIVRPDDPPVIAFVV